MEIKPFTHYEGLAISEIQRVEVIRANRYGRATAELLHAIEQTVHGLSSYSIQRIRTIATIYLANCAYTSMEEKAELRADNKEWLVKKYSTQFLLDCVVVMMYARGIDVWEEILSKEYEDG